VNLIGVMGAQMAVSRERSGSAEAAGTFFARASAAYYRGDIPRNNRGRDQSRKHYSRKQKRQKSFAHFYKFLKPHKFSSNKIFTSDFIFSILCLFIISYFYTAFFIK
jgi:hypothetical protein